MARFNGMLLMASLFAACGGEGTHNDQPGTAGVAGTTPSASGASGQGQGGSAQTPGGSGGVPRETPPSPSVQRYSVPPANGSALR